MSEASNDQLQVAFPASPTFTRIGRVAVVGLALRLGIDVATVERLRSAVDTAVSALQGAGRISAMASWNPAELRITLSNPEVAVADPSALTTELTELIGNASVNNTEVVLTLSTASD
jgi:hypothetical protein